MARLDLALSGAHQRLYRPLAQTPAARRSGRRGRSSGGGARRDGPARHRSRAYAAPRRGARHLTAVLRGRSVIRRNCPCPRHHREHREDPVAPRQTADAKTLERGNETMKLEGYTMVKSTTDDILRARLVPPVVPSGLTERVVQA